ncbi:uncharacterized protein HGUI_03621 [Hanseniaspora guilliermondii]|uniref:RING-type E3 ubiquitin transferase n=1 Tax=Hanseniaspora guilliermondii TaxID=56406 RepID=A0A1L0B6G2_9ASCO|nr:uncharacterized protein HGUI_03621 [Hanseniaspora guilliermondii]
MARIDSNTILLLVFFIFFVVLPGEDSNKDNIPDSEYERNQLVMINDLYLNEFNTFQTAKYKQPLLNITGFLYTIDDLVDNQNDYTTSLLRNNSNTNENWFGYPIENKNYDYTFDVDHQDNNYLPQNILDRIYSKNGNSIWKGDLDHVYHNNVSSTTLRGLFHSRKIQDEFKIHMPIPQLMKQKNQTLDPDGNEQKSPKQGSFFVNDTVLFQQSMDMSKEDSNLINFDISTTIKLEINEYFYYPEYRPGSLQFLSAELTKSSARFTSLISKILIVYDSQTGKLFGITNSGKFHGLFMIPQLFTNNENDFNRYKNDTVNFVNHTYFQTNKNQNNTFTMDDLFILNERSFKPEYFLYAQTRPISDSYEKQRFMNTIDLNNLYGKDYDLEIEDMLIYSPNFGLSLESTPSGIFSEKTKFKGVLGSLYPMFLQESTMKYVTLPFICHSIMFLLQISKLDSPSELNKISIDFLKVITFTDCFVGGIFIVLAIVMTTYSELTPNPSLHYTQNTTRAVVDAFMKVKDLVINGNDELIHDVSKNIRTTQFSWFAVNVVLFMSMGISIETKVLVLCIQSQFLERSISWLSLFRRFTPISTTRTQTENNQSTSEDNNETSEENNFLTNNTEGSEDFTLLYSKIQGRIYTFMVLFAFAIVFIYSMNIFLRHLICNLIVLTYTSLFWPQIFRFILIDLDPLTTNLQKRFIVVTALTRLIPVGFFYLKEDNFFQHETSKNWFIVYLVNVSVQVCLLLMQLKYGGRCIISDRVERIIEFILSNGNKSIKHRYNYSKAVTRDQLAQLGDKNEFVCPICMDNDDIIHLKVSNDVSGGEDDTEETQLLEDSNINDQQEENYMITPCNHVYHHDCLSYWMNNKLICPVCRNNLPPL